MERENFIKSPTPHNLEFVAQINDVLHDQAADSSLEPAAMRRSQRKGRLVAALFFLAIVAAAAIIYMG